VTENKNEPIDENAIDESTPEKKGIGEDSPGNEATDDSTPRPKGTVENVQEDHSIAAEEAAAGDVDTDEDKIASDSPIEDTAKPENWNIDLLLDVELPVRVSFGQTEMQLRDVFKLGAGSVIELDKSVNDPVSVIVNNKTIAKGEVVMVDGNYGIRILEVESTADRIRSLG
jgi:flagellar motor switch protein FliN/FliY